jgi:hypothetical protein
VSRSPSAAVSACRTCTASSTSDQRRPSTSSRRRQSPSARWTAASQGSCPAATFRIAPASAGSITVKFVGVPVGRWTSFGSAGFRPTSPRASARDRAWESTRSTSLTVCGPSPSARSRSRTLSTWEGRRSDMRTRPMTFQAPLARRAAWAPADRESRPLTFRFPETYVVDQPATIRALW